MNSGVPISCRLRLKEHELWRAVLPCLLLLAAAARRPSASPSRPKPPTRHAAFWWWCSRSPTSTPIKGFPDVVAAVPALLSQFYSFAGCTIPNASTGMPRSSVPTRAWCSIFRQSVVVFWCASGGETLDVLLPIGELEVNVGRR
jgi:hypothetical protein